jgi:hypothetical protein
LDDPPVLQPVEKVSYYRREAPGVKQGLPSLTAARLSCPRRLVASKADELRSADLTAKGAGPSTLPGS